MNFLKRLFGKKEKIALEPPIEFLQSGPPDWLLSLDARILPDGGVFSIRAGLKADSKTGSAAVKIQTGASGGESQTASADLTPAEAARLLVLLGFSFPDDIASVGGAAMDGVPARLAVHRREPYELKEADCNLMTWLDSKKSQPPVVEIAMLLVGVKNRVSPGK